MGRKKDNLLEPHLEDHSWETLSGPSDECRSEGENAGFHQPLELQAVAVASYWDPATVENQRRSVPEIYESGHPYDINYS